MRSRYSDPEFWVRACDRAIKASAAAMIAVLGTNVLKVTDVDWPGTVSIGALAIMVSLLTSIATAPEKK